MELNNYERELKYLLNPNSDLTFEEIKNAFSKASYALIETCDKKKQEIYYDDPYYTIIKRGDVLRGSTHFNADGTFSHFMYKKNVSHCNTLYVSKYEIGSDQFKTVQDFFISLNLPYNISDLIPVLCAEVIRKTAVFEKGNHKILVSYDNVKYSQNQTCVYEKMLEAEDWTTPYTLKAASNPFDRHLLETNEFLLKNFPLSLTHDSKPYRGITLLNLL